MKRLERDIAIKVVVIILLIMLASLTRGMLRWIGFAAALGVVVSVFRHSRPDSLERLTVTISEYALDAGQIRLVGTLLNSGQLDVYRPEFRFCLTGGRGEVLAERTVWPTGQLRRNVPSGQSTSFSLTLPAGGDLTGARLTIRSTQYPFDLVMTCDQPAVLPKMEAA